MSKPNAVICAEDDMISDGKSFINPKSLICIDDDIIFANSGEVTYDEVKEFKRGILDVNPSILLILTLLDAVYKFNDAVCLFNGPREADVGFDKLSISCITFLPLKVSWDPDILREPVNCNASAPGTSWWTQCHCL